MPADLLSLPPELTSAIFALITAASFCTSFLTAAFGLGGGVAMLAPNLNQFVLFLFLGIIVKRWLRSWGMLVLRWSLPAAS